MEELIGSSTLLEFLYGEDGATTERLAEVVYHGDRLQLTDGVFVIKPGNTPDNVFTIALESDGGFHHNKPGRLAGDRAKSVAILERVEVDLLVRVRIGCDASVDLVDGRLLQLHVAQNQADHVGIHVVAQLLIHERVPEEVKHMFRRTMTHLELEEGALQLPSPMFQRAKARVFEFLMLHDTRHRRGMAFLMERFALADAKKIIPFIKTRLHTPWFSATCDALMRECGIRGESLVRVFCNWRAVNFLTSLDNKQPHSINFVELLSSLSRALGGLDSQALVRVLTGPCVLWMRDAGMAAIDEIFKFRLLLAAHGARPDSTALATMLSRHFTRGNPLELVRYRGESYPLLLSSLSRALGGLDSQALVRVLTGPCVSWMRAAGMAAIDKIFEQRLVLEAQGCRANSTELLELILKRERRGLAT